MLHEGEPPQHTQGNRDQPKLADNLGDPTCWATNADQSRIPSDAQSDNQLVDLDAEIEWHSLGVLGPSLGLDVQKIKDEAERIRTLLPPETEQV